MPVFETYAAMEQYILQKLKDTLATDIADMVDQTIKQHAISDVYGAYSPRSYKRRGLLNSGGNYRHDLNGFSLTVTDETPGNTPSRYGHTPSGPELSEIIETGAQGNGGVLWRNAFACPYIENAQREVDLLPQIRPEAIQQAINAAATRLRLNINGIQFGNVDTSSITQSIQGAAKKVQQSIKLKPDIDMSRLSSGIKQQASSIESAFRTALTKAAKTGNVSRVNELTAAYDKMIAKAENASKISSSGARKDAESAKQELITLLGEATKTDAAVKKLSSTMKALESSAGKISGSSSNTAKVAELNTLMERAKQIYKDLATLPHASQAS